jgi:Fe-S oxidoreductase
VLLLPDPKTSLIDTQAIDDTAAGLAALGYRPLLLPLLPAGKAAHVLGDRRSFTRQAARLTAMLQRAGRTGLPIVGIEPSQTLFIRNDYKTNGVPDVPEILLPHEFLHRRLEAGDRWTSAAVPATATLLLHCTESAALPTARRQWQDIFAALGTALTIPDTGCCGMAGLYGHQQRHQDTSRKLFDLSWTKHTGGPLVHATGFSCRCQTERFSPAGARHPLALLDPG